MKDEGNKTEVEKIINAEEEMQEGPNGSPESSKKASEKEEEAEASSPKCEKSPPMPSKSKEAENPKPKEVKKEVEVQVSKPTEVRKLNSESPSPVKNSKVSSKATNPKVSVDEVLRSKHLNDASKFHVFKELVQQGQMSNQEVVNSILYLVRKIATSTLCTTVLRCTFLPWCPGPNAATAAAVQK